MRLRTRLLLVGAVIPLVLWVSAMVAAGLVFDGVLLREHDRSLMGQAGVEAVSLFDRASTPHLHLLDSPLEASLREFAPRGALYDPSGRLVTQYPADAEVPATLDPRELDKRPRLVTVRGPWGRDRQLRVRVDDPSGRSYGLWLAASLQRHDREMASYWRIAGLVSLIVGSLLLAVQVWHANRLSGRITPLSQHMARLRAGRLDTLPPPDDGADEIGALREAVAEATRRLASARASQDRIIADAAHELRTPLAALKAEIDVALHRERDSAELRESLMHARVEVDRLSALSGHLLELATLRASPIQRERVDLVPVLVDAVDAARALAERRGCIVRMEAPREAWAELAPAALRQALDNLLSNAIKFSPERAQVEVRLRAEGPHWRFEVQDRGPGVPASERRSIFEPFVTWAGTREAAGAGLGLAVVYDSAARHGGEVWVEDGADGVGALFVLRLPGLEAQSAPADAPLP